MTTPTQEPMTEDEAQQWADLFAKGHIEQKMIPDKKTGKLYGPYLYLRWWDGKRLRSHYLGKVDKSGNTP